MMLLGSIPVLDVRFRAPSVGAWIADVDLDLPSSSALPTGRQVLTVGSSSLVGTIDPEFTGRFGEKASARIVAGAGGWGKTVAADHWHNDAPQGVTSNIVTTATASAVGETIDDPNPLAYGPDFFRLEDRASSVLDGRAWYVDAAGVTHVADWPAATLAKTADVLSYNPARRPAELAADELVWPGTRLSDARFGSMVVRDVEQHFAAAGRSSVTVWLGDSATATLARALADFVTGVTTEEWARVYWYRVQSQGPDGRLQLRAVVKAAGIPATLPLTMWAGMSGLSAKLVAGADVGVIFLNGSPSLPRVVCYGAPRPLELTLDANTFVNVGGAAGAFAARGDFATGLKTALATFCAPANWLSIGSAASAASTLLTTLGGLPPPAATKARVE